MSRTEKATNASDPSVSPTHGAQRQPNNSLIISGIAMIGPLVGED
jgi:hypothetical protein